MEGEENLPHTVNCRFKGDRSRPFRKCRPFGAAPNFELVGQFVNLGRARGGCSASIIWLQDRNPDIGWGPNPKQPERDADAMSAWREGSSINDVDIEEGDCINSRTVEEGITTKS